MSKRQAVARCLSARALSRHARLMVKFGDCARVAYGPLSRARLALWAALNAQRLQNHS